MSVISCARMSAMASLAGWDGFGLAIQAYQKRAEAVIDYVDDLIGQSFKINNPQATASAPLVPDEGDGSP